MKHDLVRSVANKVGLNQQKTQESIYTAFNEIVESIGRDGRCLIVGFGAFTLKQRRSKNITDPKYLVMHTFPGHFYVTFSPGKSMDDMALAKYYVTEAAAIASPPTPALTLLGRIVDWFSETGNETATINIMASGLDVPRAKIRQVIYVEHRAHFERIGATSTRQSIFRLVPDPRDNISAGGIADE